MRAAGGRAIRLTRGVGHDGTSRSLAPYGGRMGPARLSARPLKYNRAEGPWTELTSLQAWECYERAIRVSCWSSTRRHMSGDVTDVPEELSGNITRGRHPGPWLYSGPRMSCRSSTRTRRLRRHLSGDVYEELLERLRTRDARNSDARNHSLIIFCGYARMVRVS